MIDLSKKLLTFLCWNLTYPQTFLRRNSFNRRNHTTATLSDQRQHISPVADDAGQQDRHQLGIHIRKCLGRHYGR